MKADRTIIAPALKPGSTIGIIAPAGNLRSHAAFTDGIRLLHELGFQTRFPRELWPGHDYLSDLDRNRLQEFLTMWRDPEVHAVMAARGGYGCLRIASQLLQEEIRPTPKRLIGFSDITLLHACLNDSHNIVTLHGPVVTSLARLSRKSLLHFQQTLLHPLRGWRLKAEVEVLQGRQVIKGRTAGGNLSTIVSTLGTPLQPSWKGKIVFLEDTAESTYRVDRMLTQLKLCGMLDEASAIVLGDFAHGLGLDSIGVMRHHESIWRRLLDLVDRTKPVWANMAVGHGSENMTLPLGLEAALDSSTQTLLGDGTA